MTKNSGAETLTAEVWKCIGEFFQQRQRKSAANRSKEDAVAIKEWHVCFYPAAKSGT